MSLQGVKRWSMDCKATVKIGEFSRGGLTRGDHRASDHDMGVPGEIGALWDCG